MKINKIVLYNFNSYEGLNEFDFTCENNSKNIILIGGKNGAGKTSLFTAIKIALYGPLSFGYVGVNPKYIAKIKDCINSRAFQKDVVRSKVQISVSLTVEREIKEYEITREWDYTKQKLDEKYYVKTEDRFLDGQELSYFQNYLQSMIPPDLFEFFLFDGEEVGSIFSTSTYNSYVKNAVYTLCGLDVFEIIRKYTTGYAGKASSKDEEKIYSHYKELRKNADEIDMADYNFKQLILNLKQMVDEVNLAVENSDFRPSANVISALKSFLGVCEKVVQTGVANNATTQYISFESKKLYTVIGQEWSEFYLKATANILSLLDTVKGIIPDENKAIYATNKIKKASSWNVTIDNYNYLKQGIAEADKILEDLDLDEDSEILAFLKLVSEGKATILNLTDEILAWIKAENLADKMFINF